MMEEVEGFELGFLLAEMMPLLLLLSVEEVEGVRYGGRGHAVGGVPRVDHEVSWLTGRSLLECSANDPAFFLHARSENIVYDWS